MSPWLGLALRDALSNRQAALETAPDIKTVGLSFRPFLAPEKFHPTRIIHNENAVIVFWQDGTKTIIRRREGDQDDIHSAFGQALAKKIFGATTTVHKMVDRITTEQESKKKG